MSPGHCSCPDCGTILRIRDRSFIGRNVDCPECHVKLVIQQNDDRQMFAEILKAERQKVAASHPAVVPSASNLFTRLRELSGSPLVLAWALAIGVMAFVAILMLRPAVRFRTPTKPTPDVVQAPPAESTETRQPDKPVVPEQSHQAPPENPPVVIPTETVTQEATPKPVEQPPVPEATPDTPSDAPKVAETQPAVKPSPRVPAPVRIDVEELMKQRFLRITTDKPNSRQQMIELVEEMLGVPVRYDREELGEKNLERPVSIDLEATTVGGVLKALLDSAGWEYVIEKNELRIKPKQVADTNSK